MALAHGACRNPGAPIRTEKIMSKNPGPRCFGLGGNVKNFARSCHGAGAALNRAAASPEKMALTRDPSDDWATNLARRRVVGGQRTYVP